MIRRRVYDKGNENFQEGLQTRCPDPDLHIV